MRAVVEAWQRTAAGKDLPWAMDVWRGSYANSGAIRQHIERGTPIPEALSNASEAARIIDAALDGPGATSRKGWGFRCDSGPVRPGDRLSWGARAFATEVDQAARFAMAGMKTDPHILAFRQRDVQVVMFDDGREGIARGELVVDRVLPRGRFYQSRYRVGQPRTFREEAAETAAFLDSIRALPRNGWINNVPYPVAVLK